MKNISELSEQELLELSAEALGYRVKFGEGFPLLWGGDLVTYRVWMPFVDDADAFRLLSDLEMQVIYSSGDVMAWVLEKGIPPVFVKNVPDKVKERRKAKRHAITRCAALVALERRRKNNVVV